MQRFVLKYAHHGIVKYLSGATRIHDSVTADVTDSPSDEKTIKFHKIDDALSYKLNELKDIASQWEIVKIVHSFGGEGVFWKEAEESETPTLAQENPMVAPFKSKTETDRPKYDGKEGEFFWVIEGAHSKGAWFQKIYNENGNPFADEPSEKEVDENYQFTMLLPKAKLFWGEKCLKDCFKTGKKIAQKHKNFNDNQDCEVRFYHGRIEDGVPILDPCHITHYYSTKEDNKKMEARFSDGLHFVLEDNSTKANQDEKTEEEINATFEDIEKYAKEKHGIDLRKILNMLVMTTVDDMAKDLGVTLFQLTERHKNDKDFLTRVIAFNKELFEQSIRGNKAAAEFAQDVNAPETLLSRFAIAREGNELLNKKIPHYASLSKRNSDAESNNLKAIGLL